MKISELSRTTGTPIPTIKYYIREGLLARGTPTATNQADYDESHVQRLRLIRVLREVADLSVATLTQVVAALDHLPQSIDFFGFGGGVGAQVNAAPCIFDHQPLLLQKVKRVAHGVLADMQFLREAQFYKPLAADVIPTVNGITQGKRNTFGKGAAGHKAILSNSV